MLNIRKSKLSIYVLTGLGVLGVAAGLTFDLPDAGDEAPGQDAMSYSVRSTPWADPIARDNNTNARGKHGVEQLFQPFDQIKETASNAKHALGQCSARCNTTLSMLDEDLQLDDEAFRKLEGSVHEIAAYLQNDDSKRQYYLEMALTTVDGDKRGFLTDIFKQLPRQQQADIGEFFITSHSWQVRVDGVALITANDAPSLGVANKLMSIFSEEENAYVKNNILTHLKESSLLQGDAEILQKLDSVIYNETDSSVRVEALKTKMQLGEQPYHILPDAVQALRTSEPDFQLAGLVAIDQILKFEKEYIEHGVYIDRKSLKNDIQSIRNLAVYGDDGNRFDRLVNEADAVYFRHFEY